MNAIRTLERHAIAAHRLNWTWVRFWQMHSEQVRQAEPVNVSRYHRLMRRLLHLVASGDPSGMEPISSTLPWERDDAQEATGVAPRSKLPSSTS